MLEQILKGFFLCCLMTWSFVLGFLFFPLLFVPVFGKYCEVGFDMVFNNWYQSYLDWVLPLLPELPLW